MTDPRNDRSRPCGGGSESEQNTRPDRIVPDFSSGGTALTCDNGADLTSISPPEPRLALLVAEHENARRSWLEVEAWDPRAIQREHRFNAARIALVEAIPCPTCGTSTRDCGSRAPYKTLLWTVPESEGDLIRLHGKRRGLVTRALALHSENGSGEL